MIALNVLQTLTMHSLEFDVTDVHSCNINFSNSCMYKFYSFLIVATFKLERFYNTVAIS